jgi:pentatricopeptide repeat protein
MIRTHTALALAETVRTVCLDAARQAYEDAGIRGLCADGRWEAALSAIRQMDLSGIVHETAKREFAG